MRDEHSLRDEKKRNVTNTSGTGKSLLNWLKPTSDPSRGSLDEDESHLDRRTYMRLTGGAAAAAVAGGTASTVAAAGEDEDDSGETLDVTAEPYNASGDGSNDDTAAIQSAIDDASSGDTVYFPEGTYMVSGQGTILQVNGGRHPDNLTIEGDGADSVLKYGGGNGGGNYLFFRLDGGLQDFTCRDMVFDGGLENVSGSPNAGHTIAMFGEHSDQHYHFENCIIRGGYTEGANLRGHGVTFENCTIRHNGGHGVTFGPDTLVDSRRLLMDRCLVEENTHIHSGHYGIDHARGNFLIRDTVVQNNAESATKVAGAGIDTEGKWLRVRVDNNGHHPFQAAIGFDNQAMNFEDVVVSNNGSYWRLNDPVDYSFDGDIVVTNNGTSGSFGAVHLLSSASLDGEGATLWSNNNDGSGFSSDSDHAGNTIEEYNYADNAGGSLGQTVNIDIGETNESEKTDLDAVPTADEVGAWATDDADDESDGDDEGDSDGDADGADDDETASEGDADTADDADSEDDADAEDDSDETDDGDDDNDDTDPLSGVEVNVNLDDYRG